MLTLTTKKGISEGRESKVNYIANILQILNEIKEGKVVKSSPSSVMLQILKYGKTFKRVVEHVEFDLRNFDKIVGEVIKLSNVVKLTKTYYRHKWEFATEVPKEDVEEILKPLSNLSLGDFKFRGELRYNEKFEEAVKSYVEKGKVSGKVVYDETKNRLIVFSKVIGTYSLGKYYTLLMLEPEGSNIKTTYFCTCPWARGETLDSRGRYIPPEYTSLCKHGIATLFHYFPEVATYVKLAKSGELSKKKFDEFVVEVRKAFDEVRSRAESYVSKHPEAGGVVISNIAYMLTKEIYKSLMELGTAEKLVIPTNVLQTVSNLWDSIAVRRKFIEEGKEVETKVVNLKKVFESLEKAGIYGRVRKVEELLNGLQGSRTSTLYTKALLTGLVLGADLESDPTIVSVVGDPGTGKTLTAEGLSRLVGITSLIIEKDVEADVLRGEALKQASEQLTKHLKFFADVVERKLPKEVREEARKFFEDYVRKATHLIEGGNNKELIKLAKQFAEVFASLYGVKSKKVKLSVAKLLYEILRNQRSVVKNYLSRKAVERKALEERRELLKLIAELGLITKPEDKEELNSGSVRWEIIETSTGYKVRVVLDLHYVIKKFGGDVSKLLKAFEVFKKCGKVYLRTEAPGLAELKLSEADYLEKALKVREEDILSPARRLIWVGGELTKRSVILIDESRRAPELLEKLLTDLSSAGRDTRRTNLVVTTDNAEPLMEAESDPRLDAFHSRINFEVVTPSTTVAYVISETLKEISSLERSGKTPLITFEEALLLNFTSQFVEFPERYEKVLYAMPLLLTYDFKVLRPETVSALRDVSTGEKAEAPPLILILPKGVVDIGDIKGDYEDVEWGVELPAIRMMPERRFGHHVVRSSKALAVLSKKNEVDKETFLNALEMVLMARVIPAERQSPYLYIDAKTKVVSTIVSKVSKFLSKETATEKLIEVLGSLSLPSEETLTEALEEMIKNPVAVAVFVRFLEQMLVSEHSRKFIELSKEIPGLYRTLELIARYEKIKI